MRFYSRYAPIGFTYHAAAYCAECGDTLPEVDPEGNGRYPIFGWDDVPEWTCDTCGDVIE